MNYVNFEKLSVIVPVFNEENTIESIINKVLLSKTNNMQLQIILIDDASNDKSKDIIKKIADSNKSSIKTIYHSQNQGKGAALRNGIKLADGDIILIQDADLEYDPKDYENLIKPILENKADVVYGSRFRSNNEVRIHLFNNLKNIDILFKYAYKSQFNRYGNML